MNMKQLTSGLLLAILFLPGVSRPVQAKVQKNEPRWDNWYTVTILPNTPYAYYHELLQLTKGRLHFKTDMWKKEEGFINSEQLGVFSLDDAALTPLFYNFHANYRATEISIDGTAEKGLMKVRIKRGQQELPLITRAIPSKAFFASIFPVWLQRTLNSTPENIVKSATQPFIAILEDNQDSGFAAENGRFQVVPEDEYAKSTQSVRVQVDFNSQRSFWYLDKKGVPIRIEMPGQKTRIERSTEKQAKSFLNTQ
ncbi:MAG: hypothetical protein KGQ59_06370 [Bdellovibrionales bacterium]|nr:hypothetical protein [Bdellovibrionales bacterium]